MLNRIRFLQVVSLCAGSALLAQADEVTERFRCRDLLEKTELVLASCGTCAGSALLAQTDEVMERYRWRDLLEKTKLVLASGGTITPENMCDPKIATCLLDEVWAQCDQLVRELESRDRPNRVHSTRSNPRPAIPGHVEPDSGVCNLWCHGSL